MKIYGLVASGKNKVFDNHQKLYSRKLWKSKEKALENSQLFEKQCLNSDGISSFYDLEKCDSVNIIEYELIEE